MQGAEAKPVKPAKPAAVPAATGAATAGAPAGGAAILLTAFEPSGDAHAAPIIQELIRLEPGLKIYAWGGPKMKEAGAVIVEPTCDDGSMGLNAISAASRVSKQIGQIKRWAKQYKVLAHVAVDSPAANFPVCAAMKKTGARIIHLVAPQLWAWGGWRLGKLKKLSDGVLCLLPFEQEWFTSRGVPARFIGHPSINREIDEASFRQRINSLPQGSPRLVILPGSRTQEINANIRLMVNAFIELQGRHQGMSGLIVASTNDMAKLIRKRIPVFPTGLHITVGGVDAAAAWCDIALAVSGTVTLDVARQQKPMIGIYKTGILAWLGSKIFIRTPFKLLPNIIAGREIVPEFVPHAGGASAIIDSVTSILKDSKQSALTREELLRVCHRFRGHDPAKEGAGLILKIMREGALT
jgi:lipid-A-disaccharide synthase